MNNKGFTLIELIVVIVLILIISGLITTSVMSYIKSSKETSFDLLEKSIKSSAETIYLDKGDSGVVNITINELKSKGYIDIETMKNPKNNEDISNCMITIKKVQEGNKWKYQITSNTKEACPCYNGGCN